MKSNQIAKLTNELCKEFEQKGAKHQLLVDYVGHFRVLIKYMERKPDSIRVEGDDPQKLYLHWWNKDQGCFSVEVDSAKARTVSDWNASGG